MVGNSTSTEYTMGETLLGPGGGTCICRLGAALRGYLRMGGRCGMSLVHLRGPAGDKLQACPVLLTSMTDRLLRMC